jgi:hypothetical protein
MREGLIRKIQPRTSSPSVMYMPKPSLAAPEAVEATLSFIRASTDQPLVRLNSVAEPNRYEPEGPPEGVGWV